jgi:hypothetical protein
MNNARRKDLEELRRRVELLKIAVENLPDCDELHELMGTIRDEEQDALDNSPEAMRTPEREEIISHIETAKDTLEGISDDLSAMNDNLQAVLEAIDEAKA